MVQWMVTAHRQLALGYNDTTTVELLQYASYMDTYNMDTCYRCKQCSMQNIEPLKTTVSVLS